MATILLALTDVGLGIQLQEMLEGQGHAVHWDAARIAGPEASQERPPDAVILADSDADLATTVPAWRRVQPPPALLIAGTGPRPGQLAAQHRILPLDPSASAGLLGQVLQHALRMRFAGGLSLAFARAALALADPADPAEDALRVVRSCQRADIELVREALRWHALDYVMATPFVPLLREERALTIPQVGLCNLLDGTRTVQTLVKQGVLAPAETAQLLWAMACIGAVTFTPEPPDLQSHDRRALAMARAHLRARQQRLAAASHYDVLEITIDSPPEAADHASRALALRYAPDRLPGFDLAGLAPLVEPLWQQILTARAALMDWSARGRYNDWLAAHRKQLQTTWSQPVQAAAAEDAFQRGQHALLAGDAFKAVSHLASAARAQPDHPDYEVTLAWARYRADVARGQPKAEAATREHRLAETMLVGRRPWPRALVALGLLAAAAGDNEAARWHLHEALTVDPSSPAARQILQRLGRGRVTNAPPV